MQLMVTVTDSLGMLITVMEQTISTTTATAIRQVRSCSVDRSPSIIHSVTTSARMKIWDLSILQEIQEIVRFTIILSILRKDLQVSGLQHILIMDR